MSAHHLFRRSLVIALATSGLTATVPLVSMSPVDAAASTVSTTAAPALVASDGFGRVNGSLLGLADLGGSWIRHNLGFGIRDGKAAIISGLGEGVALLPTTTANVELSVAMTLSSTNASPSVALRATDANNQLFVGLTRRHDADRLTLHKRDRGTNTQLAEIDNLGLVPGRTYQLTVTADGPTIKVSIDGVLRLTHTLSSADQATFGNRTQHGLRAYSSANSENGGSRWDDLEIRALGTTTTPPPTTPPTTTPPPTTPPTTTPPPTTAPAPTTPVVASDGFGRVNGSLLGLADLGGSWIRHNLGFGIRDGKAAIISGLGEGVALLPTTTANVELSVAMTLSSTNASPSVALRATDANNQLFVGLTRRHDADRLTLHKRDRGTNTQLAEIDNLGLVPGRTYQLTVTADGPTIKVSIDGVLRLTHTLSSADQATFGNRTQHGLRAYSSANSENGGSRWDDLEIRALGTTTTPTPTTPPTTTPPPTTPPTTTPPTTTPPTTTPPPTTAPAPTPGGTLNSLGTLVYDMYGAPFRSDGTVKNGQLIGAAPWGRHEAMPIELPSNFDFYEGARPGTFGPAGSGKAVSAWGQIFEAEPGTGTFNARAQVRNHQLFFLMSNGEWVEKRPELTNNNIEGGYWDGYFKSQGSASIRSEAANGGGSSASLSSLVQTNMASLHFWWKGWYPREVIPAGAIGVFSTAQMRLIPDTDPGIDLSRARFIASISADNYDSATHTSSGQAITAVAQPRMKFLTAEWQAFSGTNLSEAVLRNNPPPLR